MSQLFFADMSKLALYPIILGVITAPTICISLPAVVIIGMLGWLARDGAIYS